MNEEKWEGAQEVESNWFKFTKVGDKVKGTLVSRNFQKANIAGYQDQWVYELQTADGPVNVGISVAKKGTNDRLAHCKLGEIIGIMFESEGEPKKGFKPAKNLKIFTFGMDKEYTFDHDESGEEIKVDEIPFK